MSFLEFWNEWGGVLAMVVAVPWLAFGWYSSTKNTHSPTERAFWLKCCVAISVGTVAYAALLVVLEYPEPRAEFQRSGNPSLKLEVRRASTKAVDGWKASTTPDDPEGKMSFLHVSPDVELSNKDVLSTRVHFSPSNKPVSRWKGGATFLFFSVVLFVVSWRSKDHRKWCGIGGVVCLLLGGGSLWQGLTSTSERFVQQGSWQVVIRFDEAGKKKLADVTASLMEGRNEQTRSYPSNHLAVLIDGELTFVVPVMQQDTDGLFYLVHSTHLTMRDAPEGPSEEYATRIAKGIVGQ